MIDYIKDLVFLTFVLFAAFLLLCVIVYPIGLKSCETEARLMGLEYEYGAFEPCMVKTDAGWISIDNVIYDLGKER